MLHAIASYHTYISDATIEQIFSLQHENEYLRHDLKQ